MRVQRYHLKLKLQ